MRLTDRQQEILNFIGETIRDRGFAPTVREIGINFGIRSPNGVACHLKVLEQKGFVTRTANTARSIELMPRTMSWSAMRTAGPLSGCLLEVANDENHRVEFASLFDNSGQFAITIVGDTFNAEHILDGDVLILQAAPQALDTDLILGKLPTGTRVLGFCRTLKSHIVPKRIRQRQAKPGGEVEILAKVVAVVRRFSPPDGEQSALAAGTDNWPDTAVILLFWEVKGGQQPPNSAERIRLPTLAARRKCPVEMLTVRDELEHRRRWQYQVDVWSTPMGGVTWQRDALASHRER